MKELYITLNYTLAELKRAKHPYGKLTEAAVEKTVAGMLPKPTTYSRYSGITATVEDSELPQLLAEIAELMQEHKLPICVKAYDSLYELFNAPGSSSYGLVELNWNLSSKTVECTTTAAPSGHARNRQAPLTLDGFRYTELQTLLRLPGTQRERLQKLEGAGVVWESSKLTPEQYADVVLKALQSLVPDADCSISNTVGTSAITVTYLLVPKYDESMSDSPVSQALTFLNTVRGRWSNGTVRGRWSDDDAHVVKVDTGAAQGTATAVVPAGVGKPITLRQLDLELKTVPSFLPEGVVVAGGSTSQVTSFEIRSKESAEVTLGEQVKVLSPKQGTVGFDPNRDALVVTCPGSEVRLTFHKHQANSPTYGFRMDNVRGFPATMQVTMTKNGLKITSTGTGNLRVAKRKQ